MPRPGDREVFLRRVIKAIAKRMPLLGRVIRERDHLREELKRAGGEFVHPGHFYSAVPSRDEVEARARAGELFGPPPRAIPAVDLDEEGELRLLDELSRYYSDMPFREERTKGLRYFFDNDSYRHSDAAVLHCLMRRVRPKRVVEVGSGYSSCVVLDTDERFLGGSTECTFIDPEPGRLLSLLKPGDAERATILRKKVQEAGTAPFERLEKDDFLIVDSTHVSKIGSDVNFLLFEVLPRLREGVYIHFHDVFHPFEYPREWVMEGRAWNEAYLLRAFLEYNSAFEVVFFTSFMWCFHEDRFAAAMPLCAKDRGGSIWLRRTRAPAGPEPPRTRPSPGEPRGEGPPS